MLILVRKDGEDVVIPTIHGLVTITFLKATDGKVRVGFNAPKAVRIVRGEHLTALDLQGDVSHGYPKPKPEPEPVASQAS